MVRPRLTGAAWSSVLWGIAAMMFVGIAAPSVAHDEGARDPVVIDTDLGIDDAVALSMALQDPDLDVAAVVASEGVAAASTSNEQLALLLDYFNRADVPLFKAMDGPSRQEPECRARAAAVIGRALSESSQRGGRPFSAQAYGVEGFRSTILVLGPLTQLAAALKSDPEISHRIARIVVAGDPERSDSWNMSWDPEAVTLVRTSGVPTVFVRPGTHSTKPDEWYGTSLTGGQGTSLAEELLNRLLNTADARTHYLKTLPRFHDELAVLFLMRPELFTQVADGVVEPEESHRVAEAITDALSRGRQRKDRVVFVEGPLPADILQPDVEARRDAIIAANGPDEWFAQLLLNELHEHLGAYSIIGVKMGLRASELLNAPQHTMTIVSAAPPAQPVSCLNDGLLVSTGSTPGRGLFRHVPGPPGTVKATFEYNGRALTLRLKDEFRARIRSTIQDLLARYTLEDDAYWDGVRELGLEIWQDWHRRDLFEAAAGPPSALDGQPGRQP
jgi:inosine-uridine nucleoside N-ribohydrolase